MPLGTRKGDWKKQRDVKGITFFHNPNDSILPDPIQQFDILTGIEKETKVKPKDVFENYHSLVARKGEKKKKKPSKKKPEQLKHRHGKMVPLQDRGKKRGIDKDKDKQKK